MRIKCFECGSIEKIQNHHVVPKILGGTKTIPLCTSCHSKVHSKDLTKFSRLAKIGRMRYVANGGKLGRKVGTTENISDFLKKEKTQKIISLLEKGKSVRDISGRLGVSTKTVVKVRKHIYK